MRSIDTVTRYELNRSQTGEDFVGLLTISHDELADVIPLALDAEAYVLDGVTYAAAPMTLTVASDNEDQTPEMTMSFPNVDRRAGALLAKVPGACRVSLSIYRTRFFDLTVAPRVVKPATTPLTVYRVIRWFLTDTSTTDRTVSGRVRSYDYRMEGALRRRATKDLFPGLYAR
ncbi:DUF1833 family protein [Oricola sp.]|uniref:DUF1833 family protein n=1 Tax=Oricola sp. TaxID=1979950 RepID=UPI0025DF8D44|nr:DUF1833 family protein [Oricola sp.]MCI5078738.1 DUF1833 domain-containing protein [Oricola sp.]